MRHNRMMTMMMVLGLALAMTFAVGCSKKKTGSGGPGSYSSLVDAPGIDGSSGIGTGQLGMDQSGTGTGDSWRPGADQVGMMVDELPVIYFDFDSYDIKPSETGKLDAAAPYFKANPTAHVQIEGHCDSRGTDEYNMTLGEKRAAAVRDYLINSGCDGNMLHVISYGEERPVDPAENESAYALNRRVQFLVYFSE